MSTEVLGWKCLCLFPLSVLERQRREENMDLPPFKGLQTDKSGGLCGVSGEVDNVAGALCSISVLSLSCHTAV